MKKELQTTTFGLGCFWGSQEIFDQVKGVKETVVGYMGGEKKNPKYEDVCAGSGHTEVVQLKYDEEEVSFENLVKIFFQSHDSFAKKSEQYKSVIFYHNKEQKKTAEKLKKESSVTEILPAVEFWKAEEYHQPYSKKNNNYVCNE
jgi:peptide-methionine (S)-S-oxide reductase